MHRVTIYSITERGPEPQFFGEFRHEFLADEYAAEWRKLAAKAGVLIRIDREVMSCR